MVYTSRFKTRPVNFSQLVAAIRDNSYPQAIGTLFDAKNGAACAIGQGAINLGVDENDLQTQLKKAGIGQFIIRQNDNNLKTPAQIADRLAELEFKFGKLQLNVQRKYWADVLKNWRGTTVPRGASSAIHA